MLSRRHLRIRVMQALYSYYQGENLDITRTEQELLNGTNKIYELYLVLLQFFLELAHQERMYYEDHPTSHLTGQKKTAIRLLQDNAFISWLNHSNSFKQAVKNNKVSWQNDTDTLRKAFLDLRQKERYLEYAQKTEVNNTEDVDYIKWLFKDLFHSNDQVRHILEEKSIYWAESFELAENMLYRTLELARPDGGFKLIPLYKDEEDDIRFMKDLVQKTIRDDAYFQQMIGDKTKNWDADRIALVDTILMKMALCEIINISSIPVKVSINEYIDISKDYSTPNSKAFINGVIDKLVIELREQGKIIKTGRGLVE